MQAIITLCSLLLASASAGHHRDSTESNASHNFGSIYGGSPINITKVPYMALLRKMQYGGRCGAVIVSDQFVMTTALCIAHLNVSNYKVTVGTDTYTDGEDYDIDRTYIRPNYNDTSYYDDIGLIKLKKKLKFSDRVQTIKMADSNLIPKGGDDMEALGFGETSDDDDTDNPVLFSGKLPYVDLEKCKQMYEDYIYNDLSDEKMCAGGEEGKGACYSDEGGPLTYKGQLIGISVGGRAVHGLPSIFYNVPAVRDYIDLVIKSNP